VKKISINLFLFISLALTLAIQISYAGEDDAKIKTIPADPTKLEILSQPDINSYYPSFSRRSGEQGAAIVTIVVGVDGDVEKAVVAKSSSYPRLDRAATEISTRYKFKPYLIDGAAQRFVTNLKINFEITPDSNNQTCSSNTVNNGVDFYNKKNYSSALSSFLACPNDELSQRYLSVMYDSGLGVAKDDVEAAGWTLKAAQQGNLISQSNMGIYYFNGRGVAKDFSQAAYWNRKAAERGDSVAQLNLGFLYFNGQGVPKDLNQAKYWYQKAADQGNKVAQNNLQSIKNEEAEIKRKANLPKPDLNILAKCAGNIYGFTKISFNERGNGGLIKEANAFIDLPSDTPDKFKVSAKAVEIANAIERFYYANAQNGNLANVYYIDQVKKIINKECVEFGNQYGIETFQILVY